MKLSSIFKKKSNSLKMKSPSDIVFPIIFAVLLIYSLVLCILLLWGVTTSFKAPGLADYDFNKAGFPKKWVVDNYKTVSDYLHYIITVKGVGKVKIGAPLLVGYTLLYTVGCAFFATLSPCLVAYVVAKFGRKYKFFNIYTSIVIVCMIIPIVGNVPSELQVARTLGLYDSIPGMWIMKAHFLTMYYLVFLGAFQGMPDGYAEAAKIDGAGDFLVFIKIYFPLVIKTFLTIMLIQFIYFWNDYQTPILYLESFPTLALWLYKFMYEPPKNTIAETEWIAAIMILILPMAVVFIAFSDRVMGNMSLGGLKE